MRCFFALSFLVTFSSAAADESGLRGAGLLETAKSNFRAGDFDAALATLDRIDKAESPNADSPDLRGTIYLEQGKFEEAKKAFRAAHDANAARFSPRLHLGDVLLREKKFSEARDIYERLLRETKVPLSNEKLRYGVLVTYLFERDDLHARSALERIKFPTESPAYYYAQAAWEFAHNRKKDAQKWIKAADRMFDPKASAWFGRPLYDFGWLKEKPSLQTL